MSRLNRLFAGLLCAWVVGCNDQPGPVEKAARATAEEARTADTAPAQHEPALDGEPADAAGQIAAEPGQEDPPSTEPPESAGPHELHLDQSGITFAVPADWKRVKPQTSIIEAEFELPRVEGDDYDGRLTLMSSGGDPQEVISTRTGEFKQDPGEAATTDTMDIGGFAARLIDIRGEWRGASFRPMPPRADYRMLLVIIPFGERSAFYAKLTGPRSTISAHEAAFRDFLRTAKIAR